MSSGRRSLRSAILNIVCSHRRHLRLDNLRTLVLADNNLSRIQLSTDDDGASSVSEEEESEWVRTVLFQLLNIHHISFQPKWYHISYIFSVLGCEIWILLCIYELEK